MNSERSSTSFRERAGALGLGLLIVLLAACTSSPQGGYKPPAPTSPAGDGVLITQYDACIGPCSSQPPTTWRTRQNMVYKPRQFQAGAKLDLANPTRKVVQAPGPYAGWDYLALNEEQDLESEFYLRREAKVGIALYGSLPSWMQEQGWVKEGSFTSTPAYSDSGSQRVDVYVKVLSAGLHRFGKFGNVAPAFLLAEADGTPSKPPAYPAGLEEPRPNQKCPAWVHDSYNVRDPDGGWRHGWHPPIDSTYWCYFDHEHGSKPLPEIEKLIKEAASALNQGYGYVADKANKTAFCTSCHQPLEEYREGNKNYSFYWEGNAWMVNFHQATAHDNIAVNEHHTWGVTIADAGSRLLADVHLMANTGYAESAHDNIKIIHPKAKPQQDPRYRYGAHRGLPFTDQQGYGPYAAVDLNTLLTSGNRSYITVDWIRRCAPQPLIRNPFDPSDPNLYHTCASMPDVGGAGLDRWFNIPGGDEGRGFCVVYNRDVDLTDGKIDGYGYTDPLGLELRRPTDPDAVRQFVRPDLPGGQICQITELRFAGDGFNLQYYGVAANQNNSTYPYYEDAVRLGRSKGITN
ncbi:hypothetical protein [Calidithermus timidus]|uniref:hypothetical protein n=1 Tax=Calidithermus timidus TaxID=307124 RepID=UPI00035DC839|nr:hypothetical protein [Calidithermus timidus]